MFSDKQRFKQSFVQKLSSSRGKSMVDASALDLYKTLGEMIRDYVMERWVATARRYRAAEAKQVYYFSMEFLLGRLLESNLINLGLLELCVE